MFLNIKQSIALMKEFELNSADELLVIQVLAQRGYEKYGELNTYIKEIKGSLFEESLVKRLVRMNILQEEPLRHWLKNPNSILEIIDMYLTEEFANRFFVSTMTAGKELFAVYPKTTFINGVSVILQKGDKINNVYWDKDKLIELYSQKIGNNLELHNEILNKVKANYNNINFTIRSFIFDELWDSLELESPKEGVSVTTEMV